MQGLTWMPAGEEAARSMLVRWIIAFLYASKCHLRQDSDIEQDLEAWPALARPGPSSWRHAHAMHACMHACMHQGELHACMARIRESCMDAWSAP